MRWTRRPAVARPTGPLHGFVAAAAGPVLVLRDADPATSRALRGLKGSVHTLGRTLPDPRTWGAVAVVVADRMRLRASAGALPALGETPAVACLLLEDDHPLSLAPWPGWPPVVELDARRLPAGGSLTTLHLGGGVPVQDVVRDLVRAAAPGRPAPEPILVAGDRTDPGRPLDESLLNPIGFEPRPAHGPVTLAPGRAGVPRLRGAQGLEPAQPLREATPRVVAALRSHLGVHVDWSTHGPALARTVAGLAMGGIPLVGDPPPRETEVWLGTPLYDVLAAGGDITDPLRREELSIRLRRAALLTHSTHARRAAGAGGAGRAVRRFPTCSVVLATRRPEQLDFALRQVAGQRAVDLELVLVAHGFRPDAGRVRARLGGSPAEVIPVAGEVLFGDALNAGVRASSGDLVVKMDDDDWYGPDFLLDLLLAREYSGADLVGTTYEMVYLEQLHRTVRGHGVGDASERFARFVAGGSLCLPRELLDDLGGFRPVRRFVDHQLLQVALTTGATVYRSHGLGYLLRRRSDGHTWNPGDDFFLHPDRIADQWDGFVPTGLLEVDPADVPRAGTAGAGAP